MNKVFLAGRLATEPQQFVTSNGITQSRINVACSDNWNKNESYFFPCVAWQSVANFINTYLKKGDPVVIDGKLIRRSYVSREGKTVYIVEIVIETIRLFGSRPAGNYSQDNNTNYKNNKFSNKNNMSNNQKFDPKDDFIDFDENQYTSKKDLSSNDDLIDNQDDLDSLETNTDLSINSSVDSDEIVDLDWMNDIK